MKINEIITPSELSAVEQIADKFWHKLGIDVAFSKHFLDRVNDERNKNPITARELSLLFTKEYLQNGKAIAALPKNAQAVMTDILSSINAPFIMHPSGKDGKKIMAKTVMRKDNFKSPDRIYKVK